MFIKGKEMADEARDLRDALAEVCGEGDHSLGVVMTSLSALLVDTALEQAEIEPYELIGKFAGIVMAFVKVMEEAETEVEEGVEEALNEKGALQWLN
jgi:hypothetical protein